MAITIVAGGGSGSFTARTVDVTLASPAATDDVIVAWATSGAASSAITVPTGWVNVLGGNTIVTSDSHTLCCVYHIVTSGESGTQNFQITNLWNATQTGIITPGAFLLRGVDTTTPLDSAGSTFSSANATPHVLAALTGANLSTGSLVVSLIAADATKTWTTPSGWTVNPVATAAANIGRSWSRDALTTAGNNVAATNVTPSAGDEYASITVAFTQGAIVNSTGAFFAVF